MIRSASIMAFLVYDVDTNMKLYPEVSGDVAILMRWTTSRIVKLFQKDPCRFFQDFINRTSPVMMARANRMEMERVRLDRAPSLWQRTV